MWEHGKKTCQDEAGKKGMIGQSKKILQKKRINLGRPETRYWLEEKTTRGEEKDSKKEEELSLPVTYC